MFKKHYVHSYAIILCFFACPISFPVCILCSNYSSNHALMESFREKYFKERPNNFIYKDKTFEGTEEEYTKLLAESATLYVGGIKSSVTEERIWALFSIAGEIRRVIFGVNRNDLTPCGFCFVEFYERISAENAIKLFNGFRFDNSCLKCDIDYGFVNGRERGRGAYGGQVKSDIKRCKNV